MKNRSWYTYALLALIALGLLFIAYLKPKNRELQALKEERLKVEKEVQSLRLKKKEVDKIEAEIRAMTATLKELEAIIPHREEMSSILNLIQELAADSRMNIQKFTPQKLVEKEFYTEEPILIELTGNYQNLALFFDNLSNFSRLFNIEGFSISALPTQSEESTIAANSTAKTYIFRETVQQAKPSPAPTNVKETRVKK